MDYDVTLVNINLMFAVIDGSVDFQAYIPLGLMSISACLEKEGYKVDFRDYQLFVKQNMQDPFNLDFFSQFMEGSANIVGFSCMSNLLPFTLLAAKRLKEINPKAIVILGGVGPTGAAREVIENFGWIDYVCYGEGEISMLDLMAKLKSRKRQSPKIQKSVPGFYSRQDGKVTYTPRPRILDLDTLPLPRYDMINTHEYDAAFSVITSRGCPFHCAFCTETNFWSNRVVFRSIENVLEEIKLIAQHSTKKVFLFQDDQVTLNRRRAMRLFQTLIDEDLNMHWKCFVRVNLIDEELLALMAEAGCIQVRFGVESGSNRILKKINKGFTIEQAYESIRLALNYIPSVHASFIWGYPYESLSECNETMKWVRKLQDAGCTALNFLLSPLPNSEIFRNYHGPLDFNENIMANFNCSGGENITQRKTRIFSNAVYMFEFIRKYPRIFPGFYLYDYKNNIEPKMRVVYKERRLIFRGIKNIRIKDYDQVDL